MQQIDYKKELDKRMTLRDAVKTFLKDGDTISFGGMGSLTPTAFAHEAVRHGAKDLTLIGDSPAHHADLLIGTGQIKKLEMAFLAYGVPGLAHNFSRAMEQQIPQRVEIEDYTNYAIGLRFLAAAMNVPYLPTRSIVGSDIAKYNTRIKIQECPYTGQELALIPAAELDVAFIHVQYADQQGNCQIFGHSVNSGVMAKAAKHTVVSCEKIVPNEWIRKAPSLTAIPQYSVDAVVEIPFGSHPYNCAYMYECDYPYTTSFLRQYKTREGFLEWVEEHIMQVPDWETHLEQRGWDYLNTLRTVDEKFYEMPYRG